ncbi:energy-coupling factor transporter transmembrane protein EcfT [candidate division KSB1 bacterium]|nr:energy-coupling factor transporter transmembrane protein EcfT [candidate division KSB1 bacterium]
MLFRNLPENRTLNPLTKLSLLLLLTTLIFFIDSLPLLGLLSVYVLLLLWYSGTSMGMMRWLFVPFLLSMPLTFAIFIISYWMELNSFDVGLATGLNEGGKFFLRIFMLLVANILFVRTTDIRQFANALTRFRLPQTFVTLIVTVFRFFPTLLREGQRIIEVQRTRGMRPRNLLRPHHFLPIVIPLLLINMQRAHEMALSMKLRGIVLHTSDESIPFRIQDILILASHASLAIAVIFSGL